MVVNVANMYSKSKVSPYRSEKYKQNVAVIRTTTDLSGSGYNQATLSIHMQFNMIKLLENVDADFLEALYYLRKVKYHFQLPASFYSHCNSNFLKF